MPTSHRPERMSLVRALRRRRSMRAGLVQLVYILGGVALGFLVAPLDTGPTMPSAEVASLLAGLSAGLLALAGIVFALLFLVVQFAATSQSPRLHLFRDQPLVWHVLGLLVGIIVYASTCIIVASNNPTSSVAVPISVIVLVLLAVALTRRLQLEALRLVQLSPTLSVVATRTRDAIDRLYPERLPQPENPSPVAPDDRREVRWPAQQQVLQQIDLPRLVMFAQGVDATFRLRVMPGELIREDAVLLEIWPARDVDVELLLDSFEVGLDRTFDQDPLFGFRLLNDLALRAMSTAVNDPATAVQAIDSIEGLLCTLAPRHLAIGQVIDAGGAPRVLFTAPDWETFLAAGADEIRDVRMHPMVRRRLRTMLEQVRAVAPPERRGSVDRRIEELARTGS
jgi:uncharacterized membrane protein